MTLIGVGGNMDPRAELLDRLDRAGMGTDVVRLAALARLNWRVIDGELIAVAATRVHAAQQAAAAARQQAELLRRKQALDDARFNASMSNAVVAIGANPSEYLVGSSSGTSWGAPAADPRLQAYTLVHQALVQAAFLRGAPDPQVAPALAARASDVLEGRVSAADAVKLAADALPAAQRTMLSVVARIPFLGEKLVGPLVRSGAAWAAPLAQLLRLIPDALLPGQPAPTDGAIAVQTSTGPLAPPVVEALLAQAMSVPEQADALYVAALDAAEQTATIDDDVAVLEQLVRASGGRLPAEAIVRRAARTIGALARRTERRDDVARLLAWVAGAAAVRPLDEAARAELLACCRALLEARGLRDAGAIELACATAPLLVQAGKADRARLLLDLMEKRATGAPELRRALATARGALDRRPSPPVEEGLVSEEVRGALGGSLLWEDWRGDFATALALVGTRGDPVARAIVLAVSGRPGAAIALLAQTGGTASDARAAHALRLAQQMNARLIPGGDAQTDVCLEALAAGLIVDLPAGSAPATAAARRDAAAIEQLAFALTLRTVVGFKGWRRDPAVDRMAGAAASRLDEDASSSVATTVAQGARSPLWLALAAADLHRRDGDEPRARHFLELARRAAGDDAHSLGELAMVEGHWASGPLESPLTLGLWLANGDSIDSAMDEQVERRERQPLARTALAAATAAYERAAAAFARAGSPRGLAAVTLSRAGLAALAGDHLAAATLAATAERDFAAAGDELGRHLARTHRVIAMTATGAPVDAAEVAAIGAWGASTGSISFAVGCARLLSRSGRRALYGDGDVERALALHDLAAALLGATPFVVLAAQARVDRAEALSLASDHDGAADALERAAALLDPAPGTADVGDARSRRALCLARAWQIHNQRGASEGLERVTRQLAATLPALQVTGSSPTLLQQAAVLQVTRMLDVAPAIVALYRAREVDEDPERTAHDRQAAWATALDAARAAPPDLAAMYEAVAELGRGDLAAAAASFRRHFDRPVAAEAGLPFSAATERLAELAASLRDREAFSSFVRARDLVRAREALDRLHARDPDWSRHTDEPWNDLASVGELCAAEGDHRAALAAHDEAIELIEARRSRMRQDTLRRSFVDTSSIHAIYVNAARVAIDEDPARAFALVERGRARALLDLAHDRRSAASAWRAWDAQCGALRNLLAVEAARPQPDAARIEELRARLVAVEARRPPADERGASRSSAPVVALADLAAALPADVALLQYALADDVLLSWAITSRGMVAHRSAPIRSAELRRTARRHGQACARGVDDGGAGRELAGHLLEPFADVIRAARHVIVVPTDALHLLAFHALPFGGAALLDAVAVSYAPSASFVRVLGTGPVGGGPLLVVGDPSVMSCVDDDDRVVPLRPLPGAGAEARRIAALYPGTTPLVGAAATLTAVRDAIPGARLVHLATHGVVSARSPWLSTIALAQHERLDLVELAELDLRAELVTFSACDSARGTVGKGDEVFGFARGLLAAGARRVVVSLWPVSDLATCELMTVFYRELAAGRPAALALRTAQLRVRGMTTAEVVALAAREPAVEPLRRRDAADAFAPDLGGFAHPSFWAPFVLVGA